MTGTRADHPGAGRGGERELVLGPGLRATILTTGEETGGRHDVTYGVQPPGAATPLHVHSRYDERLWVVSGSLTAWAGPERVVLRPGDFYVIPMGTAHALQAGADGAAALNISSPAGFAELVQRTGTPARLAGAADEFDAEHFFAVSREMGDVVLGPPGTTP
jgi:mannose-6-phosphate isomerase-like protein (cupin superfamily)